MASYFFELRGGDSRLKDEDVHEFATARQAESYGRLVAYDLARNHAPESIVDLYLAVMDEGGEDVARINLIEVSVWIPS